MWFKKLITEKYCKQCKVSEKNLTGTAVSSPISSRTVDFIDLADFSGDSFVIENNWLSYPWPRPIISYP